MNRKIQYGIIATAGAVVMTVAAFSVFQPMTPAKAAQKVLQACEAKDGGAFWSLIPPEERKWYKNPSVSSVQALLDLLPSKAQWSPSSNLTEQDNTYDGSVTVGRQYKLDQVSTGLTLRAEIREDHVPFVVDPIKTVLYFLLLSSGAESVKGASSTDLNPLYLKGIDHLAATLTRLGFPGVMDHDGIRMIPWSEVRSQFAERINPSPPSQ